MESPIFPGELKNIVKTSLAFSNPENPFDYLKKVYERINHTPFSDNVERLSKVGFTLREIEILTGISKSQIGRILK